MMAPETRKTRERLLDAAERLLGERGLDAVSLREITREAGANVAAVNYHFGSKDALLKGVLLRHMIPLNEERLRLLVLAESAAGDSPPTLESILHAFTGPTFRMMRAHPNFMRFVGQLQLKQAEFGHLLREDPLFPELVDRMRRALIRALPSVPAEEIWWGVSFLLGAMIHTWTCWQVIESISGGEARYGSDDEMIERLVRFTSAGLRALAPAGRGEEA